MEWHEVLLRLGIAVLFGLIVGTEREHRHRPAGIKTHILVCVGAALVSLIQVEMVAQTIKLTSADPNLREVLKADVGRLGAQVISGIGFLGAGTILRNKGTVQGLTTAATLWLTACVGLAVGMGYYRISLTAILLTMTVLIILRVVQNLLLKGRGVKRIEVSLFQKEEAMQFIHEYCARHNIRIDGIEFGGAGNTETGSQTSPPLLTYTYLLLIPRTTTVNRVLTDWQMDRYVVSAVAVGPAAE